MAEDWTKKVTIAPIDALVFQEKSEDKKPLSYIKIINQSEVEYNLFKV